MERLEEYMHSDQYGKHTICTLYYDTEDYLLIRRSIENPKYKEKLRLQSYGIPEPDSTVFLELKKKLDGITFDSDIRFRSDRLDLTLGGDDTPLLLPGERIMEIKVSGAFPCWLSRMLSELKIYPTSFSKYGTVYRILQKEVV